MQSAAMNVGSALTSRHSLAGTRVEAARPPAMAAAAAGALKVTAVATPSRPPTSYTAKRSAVEIIKQESDFLRHPLMEELVTPEPFINEAAMQLMKFHGSYMQDEREKRAFGKGKSYQFMMRTRQPAGVVSNQLYLAMDDLADQYGNGTLRLTTRQTYQLHGILKQDLKTVFSTVIKNMGSTLGACGDVNRNVMGPPAPYKNRPEYDVAIKMANDIADLFAPQSGAYYDVWLDGEKFMSATRENPEVTKARMDNTYGTNFEGSAEPLYGTQFLPRKFKVAVTVPGDNSVDLFTNDLGVVVICDAAGNLQGANIYAGGGLGRTHRNNDTAAMLAVPLGYVAKEDIFAACKAILATQRDYGRRDDRKQSRLKYLVSRWGVDKFRSVCEQYMGTSFQPEVPLPPWKLEQYHGWIEQGDGKLAYGLPVVNGRLKGAMKQALRNIIERYELPVKLTGNQDIILTDIDPKWKEDVMSTLRGAGVADYEAIDPIVANSMACPAMPLCGLAIGEAERGLPAVNARLRSLMTKCGLEKESLVVRMTGCPNGCARPYMAELGFVCDGPGTYQMWLGACPNQTRISEAFMDKMKLETMEETFEPIFMMYKGQRSPNEAFGDFCHRVGFDALRAAQAAYSGGSSAPAPAPSAAAAPRAAPAAAPAQAAPVAMKSPVVPPVPTTSVSRMPRVMVNEEAFTQLQKIAEAQGKTLAQVASEAILSYGK